MTFDDLNLAPAIVQAVREHGYETPTPIQAEAIPAVLAGRDLLGGAQTGPGTTAAFTLPRLQRLADGDLNVAIDEGGKDEIGRMAQSMQIFREAAIDNKRLETEAEGNRKKAEADRIADQQRAESDAAERLRIATSGLAQGLKRLSAGELSFQLVEPFAPDFEALRHDFNNSVKQLNATMAAITDSVSTMETGTREIANGTDHLS
eukprot:gene67678-92697_t